MGRHIGYDRYGRAGFGFRSTYSITPASSVYCIVSPTWTAEKVDTDTGATPGLAAGSVSRTTVDDQSWVEGDSNYIGTEVDLGFTWRFSPNAAFDLEGSYLFAGARIGTAECAERACTRVGIPAMPTSWLRACDCLLVTAPKVTITGRHGRWSCW